MAKCECEENQKRFEINIVKLNLIFADNFHAQTWLTLVLKRLNVIFIGGELFWVIET